MKSRTILSALLLSLVVAAPTTAVGPRQPAATRNDRTAPERVVAGPTADNERILVRFRSGLSAAERAAIVREHGLARLGSIPSRRLVSFAVLGRDAPTALEAVRREDGVLSVSVEQRREVFGDPTGEPRFAEQWGLENTGQDIAGFPGVPNVDIDAVAAHAITTGDPALVVAVIDDGVDFDHPDLADRAWTNPGESGLDGGGIDRSTNGVDDDANGYVDDVHGWDFCHGDATVHDLDDDGHGTHVAATIAGSLDGAGIAGVAPSVRIMALKFLSENDNCGWDGMAIEAIEYAKSFGIRISNNSWGGGGYNADLEAAVAGSGMLFVAAAGNGGLDLKGDDIDVRPVYPASFDAPNVLTVAAVHNQGGLSYFSNFGLTSVDISAPGEDILSAIPATSVDPSPGWEVWSGTSMAAPHVTGVAALAASARPALLADPIALRAHVLRTGKVLPKTVGRTATGRIVDAAFAVDQTPPVAAAPTAYAFVAGSILGTSTVSLKVAWPAATDDLSGIGAYYLATERDGTLSGSPAITGERSLARTVSFGSAYRFLVRARDRAGNLGAYARGASVAPQRYQESSTGVTYSGTWGRQTSTSFTGGAVRYATRAGARVSFSFTGRAVAVVAPKSASRGSAKVYVDGTYIGTVSLYRSNSASRVLVFTKSWSRSAKHTLTLVVVGTAGHPRFDIDAFAVLR
ncbi:MAG: S8 family serine peptidase [Chloroflexi bacterium]|nr:S8 family serine peptidase [Chloroflexota bacterium]